MHDETLRARLRDLRDAAAASATPPGVEQARRTLRHRHGARVLASGFAIVGVVATAVYVMAPPLRSHASTKPLPPVSASPSSTPISTPVSPAPSTHTPAASTSTPAVSRPPGASVGPGIGLAPFFVDYGDNLSTTVGQSSATKVPLGVMTWGRGTATNVRLTADFSQITSKVDIVAVSSPCSRTGSTVTCAFSTLTVNGQKKIGATVSLRGKPGVPPGAAGRVRLRLSANPTPATTTVTSGTVYVSPSVADLVITSTTPTANIGQTVTVSYTVTNQGPALEPSLTLTAGGVQPGTQYVGGSGCTTTATTFECRIDNLGVGQTMVVSVKVKVTGCVPKGDTSGPGAGFIAAVDDPNTFNNDVQMVVRVNGCP